MRKLFAVALAGLTLAGAAPSAAAVQTAFKPPAAVTSDAGFQKVGYYDRRYYHGPRHYRPHRYYSRPRYYDRGYYYRRDRDDGDAVAAAIAGGVLGYALGAYSQPRYNDAYRYYSPPQYYAPPRYYAPRYCYDFYGRAYHC